MRGAMANGEEAEEALSLGREARSNLERCMMEDERQQQLAHSVNAQQTTHCAHALRLDCAALRLCCARPRCGQG